MSKFRKNYLPSQSVPWGREVEERIVGLEVNTKAAEINNKTRDDQLRSSYNRLDTAFKEIVVAVDASTAASTAATAASAAAAAAAATANTAATTANTAATNAQAAIDGLGSLDEATSTYKINAANLTVGTLSGNRISGGTITGTLLNTASSGARIEMGTNNILFYDDSGDYSGKIDAEGNGRGSTLTLDQGGVSGMYIYNGGVEVYANGPFGINTQQTISYGQLRAESGLVVSSGANISGGLTVGQITSTGSSTFTNTSHADITASGDLNLTGRILGSTGTYNATTTSTANLFVGTNGNFARSTSSRRYKSDIQDIDYGLTALQLQPRTWVDKSEYEANGNSTDGLERIPGFIAEELHDLGLTELVQYNEDGQPDAVYYDRMLVAVIPVIKSQQARIESLEARLTALENRVQ